MSHQSLRNHAFGDYNWPVCNLFIHKIRIGVTYNVEIFPLSFKYISLNASDEYKTVKSMHC